VVMSIIMLPELLPLARQKQCSGVSVRCSGELTHETEHSIYAWGGSVAMFSGQIWVGAHNADTAPP